MTFAAIAANLRLPVSTVKSIVAKESASGHVHTLLRSGRPRKTDERLDHAIVRAVKKNRRVTAIRIAEEVSMSFKITLSPSTIRNRLHAAGLKGRAARKKPYLTKKHKAARTKYADDCLKFTPAEWQRVVFSDESSVWMTGSAGRVFVWRSPGEEFNEECTVPTFKSGRETLMVWGCITWEGVGALHICTESVNAAYYKTILEGNLQATTSVLGLTGEVLFVQDGAPAHRARATKKYLEERNVRCLNHPAQSPDLNPIENLWAHLKREVSKNPASSKSDLIKKLEDIWYDIDPLVVQKLYESMPKRLQQVKKNKGGHTKY